MPVRSPHRAAALLAALLLAVAVGGAPAQEAPRSMLRRQSFDRDPGWEGHGNRALPRELPTVTQDFGYSRTAISGNTSCVTITSGARKRPATSRPMAPMNGGSVMQRTTSGRGARIAARITPAT